MSNSKLLPPFMFDTLYYLNRDQLERFSIICRPLKNFIDRYFHSKPYRIFDRLYIRRGLCALHHNNVQWHPNRDDYSVQQFLAGQKCRNVKSTRFINPNDSQAWFSITYYSFTEIGPYLGLTVRIKETSIYVAGDSIYSPVQINEMESISYLWRNGKIHICNVESGGRRIVAEDFQPILNSPAILHCRYLHLDNANFSFKDYKVLLAVKVIEAWYSFGDFNPNCWAEFFEQPGVKPLVVIRNVHRELITNTLDQLCEAFSSAVLPNTFKWMFTCYDDSLTEFRKANKTSGEKLELKKGAPVEYHGYLDQKTYTLERSSI